MATVLRIIDLDGKAINIIKGRDQSWNEVIQKANLPRRFDFCIRHWMSDDPNDTQAEELVKAYLDRVGYIMIQDSPDPGILTDYKELRDQVAFVPVSGHSLLENLYYSVNDHDDEPVAPIGPPSLMTKREQTVFNSLTKPKKIPEEIKRIQAKRKRIDAMRTLHPDATSTFLPVDTENCFVYNGKTFKIDDLEQYRPRRVRGEDIYDMDQIVCVKCDNGVFWYDQDFNAIDGHVHEA